MEQKSKSLETDRPALQVQQLTVHYGSTPVLWDISLAVPEGKLVGILGPNGAGKSTLLRAALGLVQPVAGRATFWGQSLKAAKGRIAYVPQRESVDWDFPITVEELVLMGCYGRLGLFRRPSKGDRQAAQVCLEKVGMTDFAHRQISQLSGGQQQRAFIARALMQDADIYFMDEPLAGIDMASEKVVMGLLQELRDSGKTVFVVHHDLNTVEAYFDWVILLNLRLIASGPTSETFIPETLQAAYGTSYALFDEALKLSNAKSHGVV